MSATTPEQQAQAVLRATPTEELLTKAYQLTHRVHEALADCGSTNAHSPHGHGHGGSGPRCSGLRVGGADLRAMRDLITAEVVRRAEYAPAFVDTSMCRAAGRHLWAHKPEGARAGVTHNLNYCELDLAEAALREARER